MSSLSILQGNNPGDICPRFKHDRMGVCHFRPGPLTSAGAAAFRSLQLRVLDGSLDTQSWQHRVLASFVLFDGIATYEDLIGAAGCLSDIYRIDQSVVLEWNRQDGRLNRRILSGVTLTMLPDPPTSIPPREAANTLEALCVALFPGEEPHKAASFLFACHQAWLYESVSHSLLAHALGIVPLTPLPKSALIRKVSGFLVAREIHLSAGPGLDAISKALEPVFDPGESNRRTSGGWVIDQLLSNCKVDSNKSSQANKRAMLSSCITLADKLGDTSLSARLIVAWAVHLLEQGTPSKANLAPTTVSKYVRAVAHPLKLALDDKDLGELSGDEFQALYAQIISSTSSGQRGTSASSLSSFHQFLIYWLDTPPLHERLHPDIPIIPSAQIVWDHEISRIMAWLSKAHGDERLISQVRICIQLAFYIRLRAQELFRLRLHNIIDHGDAIEVEVAPKIRDGRLKSAAARRIQVITNSELIAALRGWIQRRRAEHAGAEDFVFGAPYQYGKGYRIGATYALINELLRAATGEPEVSLHTLSHTRISLRVEQALCNTPTNDINPLDMIATEAGHASAATSLFHYSHLIERPLRDQLDRAIRSQPITSSVAGKLSRKKASTLRQRASSRGISAVEVMWDSVLRYQGHVHIPDIASGQPLYCPLRPEILNQGILITLKSVIDCLRDIQDGFSGSSIALRLGLTESMISKIASTADSVELRLRRKQIRRSHAADGLVIPGRVKSASEELRHSVPFHQIGQMKYQPLMVQLQRRWQDIIKSGICEAWQDSYDRGYFSLNDINHAARLFKILHQSSVQSDSLGIAFSYKDAAHPSFQEKIAAQRITDAFTLEFSVPPLIFPVNHRRSRPATYLLWSSTPLRPSVSPAPAAGSTGGLNAIFFSLTALASLVSNTSAPKSNRLAEVNHE